MVAKTETRRTDIPTETLNLPTLPPQPALFAGLPGVAAQGYAPYGLAPGFAPYPAPFAVGGLPWPAPLAYPGFTQGFGWPQAAPGFVPANVQSLGPLAPPQGQAQPSQASIPVALQDLGREVVATFEVPGIAPADLNIVVGNTTVTVRTLRPAANGRVYQGTFALPAEVLPSQASARLEHGLLVLTLPRRTPTEEPRRVEVEG